MWRKGTTAFAIYDDTHNIFVFIIASFIIITKREAASMARLTAYIHRFPRLGWIIITYIHTYT